MAHSRKELREENNQKSHKPRRWLWPSLLILIIVGTVYGLKVISDVKSTTEVIYESVSYENLRDGQVDIAEGETPISVLLMGIDSGGSGIVTQGRSDTMIIGTLNPNTEKTVLYSLPRDSLVTIPGMGQDKINHAYSYGGASLAIETVQNLFSIPIDYYVAMDMQGLTDIVNAVGGITVLPNLTFDQHGHHFQEGVETKLSGEEALAYSRMRDSDPQGDYGRQARQREVIVATVNEIFSISTLWNYSEILSALENNVVTNMDFDNLVAILTNYRNTLSNISQNQLLGYGQTINGVYYEIIPEENIQAASQLLQSELEYYGP